VPGGFAGAAHENLSQVWLGMLRDAGLGGVAASQVAQP